MFTVIAERINMTRKAIRTKVWERDEEFIAAEAIKQAAAGATHIDVNAGGDPNKEVADMKWLAGVVSEAVELPLSFDSANPEALATGLAVCNRPGTIINSINLESGRIADTLGLVKDSGAGVICLTMDDSGMPEDAAGRIAITERAAGLFASEGIGLDRVYFDHLVRPCATNPGQMLDLLEAVAWTRKTYPDCHISAGLSNVSFGLPRRNYLNLAFLAMLVAAGADAAIIDPTANDMITMLHAARAIIGQDEYGMAYLTRLRELGEA